MNRVENNIPRPAVRDEPVRRQAEAVRGASASFEAILSNLQQQAVLDPMGDDRSATAAQLASLMASAGRIDPQIALALALAVSKGDPSGASPLPLSLPAMRTAPSAARSARALATRAYASKDSGQVKFDALKPVFQQSERQTGIPWQIQAAQWALETGWGGSTPKDVHTGQESFNLFGIKGEGPAGSVSARTMEHEDGAWVEQVASFRAYGSYQESILEHAHLLNSAYYAPARAAGGDLRAWTEQLGPQHLGYATDPDYSRKLWQIIESNGWHQKV